VTLNVTGGGSGSVGTPYSCAIGNTGVCSVSKPFGTHQVVYASRQAVWSGTCSPNGPNPSTDGVVIFNASGTCNIALQ